MSAIPPVTLGIGTLEQQSASKATSGSDGTASPADRKLRKAAAEFESLLLSNLWKSMKTAFASDDDDDSTDPAHESLEDFGMETMAGAVGKAGGLGIGKLILQYLEPKLQQSASSGMPEESTKVSAPSDDKAK